MINSDSIEILVGNSFVSVSESGSLQTVGKTESLKFGDFVSGYHINGYGSEKRPGLPANAIVKANLHDGQPWELSEHGIIDLGDEASVLSYSATRLY